MSRSNNRRAAVKAASAAELPVWLRPFRNAGVLLMGRAMQGILSVAYVALAARALGVEGFGLLVLLHSLVLSVAQFSRFQTWQAVMKFGAEAVERRDSDFFRGLTVFAVRLDVASALVALAVLSFGMGTFAELLGLPEALLPQARVYAFLVVVMVLGSAPLGVLRLFDRHDLSSWQTIIEPLVRVVGAAFLFFNDGTLPDYIVVWFAASVASEIATWLMAIAVLRAHALVPSRAEFFGRGVRLPAGMWRFVIGTNINSTLNLGNAQLGILLAGWLLGPSGAGYYRIAKQFADVLIKPSSKLLVPAIYTDMAELTAKGDGATREHVVRRSVAVAGLAALGVFLVLVFFGKALITLLVGAEYTTVYATMLWLALAGLLAILAFPFEPLLVSAGRVRATVITRLSAIVVFFAAFYVLGSRYGLVGTGMATAINAGITTTLFYCFGHSLLKARDGQACTPPP